MNEELKPCPFCGGRAKFEEFYVVRHGAMWYVECSDCFVRTDIGENKKDIAKLWNNRRPVDKEARK